MSRLLFMKTLPQQLVQPTGIAIAASLGIHALLALSLPNISKASKQADQTSRDVKVVELTPAEESRVPPLNPSPSMPSSTPQVPLYESQPLPPPLPSLSYYPPTSSECSVNSPTLSRRKKGESSSSSSSQAKRDKGVKSSLSEQYCLDELLASGGITKPPKSMKDTPRALKEKDSKKKLEKASDRKNNGTSGYPLIDRAVGQNNGVPSGVQSQDPRFLPTPQSSSSSNETGLQSSPRMTGVDAGTHNPHSTFLLSQAMGLHPNAKLKTGDSILRGSIDYPSSMGCPEESLDNAMKGFVIVNRDGKRVEDPQLTPPSRNDDLNQQALAKVKAHEFPKANIDEPDQRIYQFRFDLKAGASCAK